MITRTHDGWERDCWGWLHFWGVPPHPSTQGIWDILHNHERRKLDPAGFVDGLIGVPRRVIHWKFPQIEEGCGISIDDIVSVQPLAIFTRACGDCICEDCGKKYYDHPLAKEEIFLSYDGHPFLNRLCNGKLVKL